MPNLSTIEDAARVVYREAQAIRDLMADPHSIAESAGAASFAAAMQERAQLKGQVVGTTLCGSNVDSATLAQVLAGL
ncbi:MAG: hypothetical protein MUP33_13150 [Polaromonas sp.]|nr:hypothetical protein [Polaromonas sp.]